VNDDGVGEGEEQMTPRGGEVAGGDEGDQVGAGESFADALEIIGVEQWMLGLPIADGAPRHVAAAEGGEDGGELEQVAGAAMAEDDEIGREFFKSVGEGTVGRRRGTAEFTKGAIGEGEAGRGGGAKVEGSAGGEEGSDARVGGGEGRKGEEEGVAAGGGGLGGPRPKRIGSAPGEMEDGGDEGDFHAGNHAVVSGPSVAIS